MLQSTLFDLKNTLLQNGYPRGVLCYNINDVLNRQKNRSAEPATTVPKKDIILVLWAFKVKLLLDVLNLVLVSFMAVSILGLFFKTLAGLSLFFPTKIVSVVLKDQKMVYKASCWDCDSFYIGKTKRRLHDRKSEHFKALTQVGHASAVADHTIERLSTAYFFSRERQRVT